MASIEKDSALNNLQIYDWATSDPDLLVRPVTFLHEGNRKADNGQGIIEPDQANPLGLERPVEGGETTEKSITAVGPLGSAATEKLAKVIHISSALSRTETPPMPDITRAVNKKGNPAERLARLSARQRNTSNKSGFSNKNPLR